jgi:hypothetical protein
MKKIFRHCGTSCVSECVIRRAVHLTLQSAESNNFHLTSPSVRCIFLLRAAAHVFYYGGHAMQNPPTSPHSGAHTRFIVNGPRAESIKYV